MTVNHRVAGSSPAWGARLTNIDLINRNANWSVIEKEYRQLKYVAINLILKHAFCRLNFTQNKWRLC
jgi:hypothetical protein